MNYNVYSLDKDNSKQQDQSHPCTFDEVLDCKYGSYQVDYEQYYQQLNTLEYQFSNNQKGHQCWNKQEDKFLNSMIYQNEKYTWTQIAESLQKVVPRQPPRTGLMCSQRWNRVVNPQFDKGKWSLKEDQRLLRIIMQTRVAKWSLIALQMSGRSDVQVRHRIRWHCDWFVQNGAPQEYLKYKQTKEL
ncbi:Myb-like_DNA-binding domain-containing protein [Hexamita inflata]|uniref:Myb-like DNA-binding domain-containing protein n=1 Tax=Hexamita inflata TaxID=28002 RepID=A0AA86RFD5_9EUKA|nr:Myb-like DNA-binding domain-containing protein [Hexamita inflata]CAI9972273.1 Myb-like DNA-binding domain-containing protein [Hexamita inflata]CAI9972276.1 Myb-like DNA-binding domain-containing protein [Hexamita inflata]